MDPIIKACNISKSFGTLKVLKGIDLEIYSGEIVSIVGPSGAGKTTLLQILGTLSGADAGSSLSIRGIDLSKMNSQSVSKFRGEHIGFIFQSHQLLPEFTASENVVIPAMIIGGNAKQAHQRALELLDRLGLKDRAKHKPSELSGGECQRVAVARAMMNRPSVIFADEPSGSLDTQNKEALHQLFFDLREEFGQTFVIVTHDIELARKADRMVCLRDGKIDEIICRA